MTRNQRIGVSFGLMILLCLLIYLLRSVLVPVFIALFFAYLLDPVIDRMEARKLNRSASVVILGALIFIVLGTLGTFFAIQTEREIEDLVRNLPEYLKRAHAALNPLAIQHLGREIPFTFDEIFNEGRKLLGGVDPGALKPVSTLIARISSSTYSFISSVFGLIIIPVFLFYFLRDWDRMKWRVTGNDEKDIEGLVPLSYRDYVIEKARTVDDVLSSFFRGQLTVAGILGVIYSIGLLSLGVDLAVVIGIASGILFIIPYVGTAIGLVAAAIMVFLEYGLSWRIPASMAVFAIGQTLEGLVLTPRITGDKVGLSPVAVIFSLMIGAELLGFLGILIAVPLASVVNVLLKDLIERYRNSEYFRLGGEPGVKK